MKALLKRVVIKEIPGEISSEKSTLAGVETIGVRKVEVIDWGTDEDLTPTVGPSTFAYVRDDTKGVKLPDGTSVIDRGFLLAID